MSLGLVTAPAAPTSAQTVERVAALVDSAMAEWQVTGLSLAIVCNDSVVFAGGFGQRDALRGGRVDDRTLFAVGSTTKAFTSALAAMMVGEGMLSWDDRLVDRVPGFSLSDAWVTAELTLRDALAHRSGLPMANVQWLIGVHDRDELIRRLRHLDVSGFRAAFSYQNVLYVVAARALERASGVGWAEMIERRLFDRIGMRSSRALLAGAASAENRASPHVLVEGLATPVPYRDIDALGPAGSIQSNAADMARWLRFQLAGGRLEDDQVIDREALLETRRPQIVLPYGGPLAVLYPEADALAYGMGWVVAEYAGRTLLDHTGGIDGMTSLVALMPEESLGVAILTNVQLSVPPYWLLYPLLDLLLGRAPIDRDAAYRELAGQAESITSAVPARRPGLPRSFDLTDYAGRYVSEAVGELVVTVEEDGLRLRLGRFDGRLEHWHLDTFRAHWSDIAWSDAAGPGWVSFLTSRDATVAGLELSVAPGETWRFERGG